jgi:hypothetical protein
MHFICINVHDSYILGLKNSNIYRKLNPIFIKTPLFRILRVDSLTFKLESTPFFIFVDQSNAGKIWELSVYQSDTYLYPAMLN